MFPKILSLLNMVGGKVHITTPVHKGNLAEIGNVRNYFAGYGAQEPQFTQIGNRSWDGGPWKELSLSPVGGYCHPNSLRTFVIDWDGAVLACCSDFSKSAKLGDLTNQTIAEVLESEAWREMFEIHRSKRWSQKDACNRCRTDHIGAIQEMVRQEMVRSVFQPSDEVWQISGNAFRISRGVWRDDGKLIRVDRLTADGIVIYGPYRRIAPGRYRVRHFFEITGLQAQKARLALDVVTDCVNRIASRLELISDVLSGAVRSENSATGPAKAYQAGDSFFEPAGSEHLVSENASATEPASLLAVFVADDGAQLTTFETKTLPAW